MKRALDLGWTHAEIYRMTGIDPWFLDQMQQIVDLEKRDLVERCSRSGSGSVLAKDVETLREAKRMGFSDARLAQLTKPSEGEVRAARKAAGIVPVYKRVDTCAAEFESYTPYLYSTYESEGEAAPTDRRKVVILGSGPNRIGQGIEFDYCCCHASFAFKEEGYETIMVNCNPETVSTDYDTSDRLYFEPLDLRGRDEHRREGEAGGRGRPVRRPDPAAPGRPPARGRRAGSWARAPTPSDLAEDRKRFSALLDELDIPQPESGTATSLEEAKVVAERIGYPVLVRPSYVLGGRAMAIVYDAEPPRGLRARGGQGLARASDPRRPLPRGRLRGGRGRPRRRRAGGDRRHPAAHRGGGHPQRRLRDGAAHLQDHRAPPGDDPALHAAPGPRPRGARA